MTCRITLFHGKNVPSTTLALSRGFEHAREQFVTKKIFSEKLIGYFKNTWHEILVTDAIISRWCYVPSMWSFRAYCKTILSSFYHSKLAMLTKYPSLYNPLPNNRPQLHGAHFSWSCQQNSKLHGINYSTISLIWSERIHVFILRYKTKNVLDLFQQYGLFKRNTHVLSFYLISNKQEELACPSHLRDSSQITYLHSRAQSCKDTSKNKLHSEFRIVYLNVLLNKIYYTTPHILTEPPSVASWIWTDIMR